MIYALHFMLFAKESAARMSKQRTANLLGALACEIADRLDRGLKSHPNQTDSAAAALNLIGDYDGCSNSALSRALQLSHTATVRMVDKLEAAGLVDSRRGEDRRSVALYLTKAGRKQAHSVVADRNGTLNEILASLTSRQSDQLASLIEVLLAAMTESADAANHICRLCDDVACPPESCPVHQAAEKLAGA